MDTAALKQAAADLAAAITRFLERPDYDPEADDYWFTVVAQPDASWAHVLDLGASMAAADPHADHFILRDPADPGAPALVLTLDWTGWTVNTLAV